MISELLENFLSVLEDPTGAVGTFVDAFCDALGCSCEFWVTSCMLRTKVRRKMHGATDLTEIVHGYIRVSWVIAYEIV